MLDKWQKDTINRQWSMPNSKTFKIKPIKELIKRYIKKDDVVVDGFANESSIKNEIQCKKYISNDLDPQYDTDYHLEAQDFMKLFDDNSIDVVLFDPPYSNRQVSECYKKLDKTVTTADTSSGYFTRFKDEIKRILKPNGICISFGWNTNGIGNSRNFKIVEILIVPHGGMHNDTLVTVERKLERRRILY